MNLAGGVFVDVISSPMTIPDGIPAIRLDNLEPGNVYAAHHVVGKVATLFPLSDDSHICSQQPCSLVPEAAASLKLLLADPETLETYPVLFYGPIARQLSAVVFEGASLALTGFRAERRRPKIGNELLQSQSQSQSQSQRTRPFLVLRSRPGLTPQAWLIQHGGPPSHVNHFLMSERYDVCGVVKSVSAATARKQNAAAVILTSPTMQSLVCVVKGWQRLLRLQVAPGDIFMARKARVVVYKRDLRALVSSTDVVVFKRLEQGTLSAFNHFGATDDSTVNMAEVLELAEWGSVRELADWNGVGKVHTYLKFNDESRDTFSSLARYRSADVTCLVAAVRRGSGGKSAFLSVWDGTLPSFNVQEPPTTSAVLREDGQLCGHLSEELVSVTVVGAHVGAALDLNTGSHVQLRGLTVRMNPKRGCAWIVLESRYSNSGIVRATTPCPAFARLSINQERNLGVVTEGECGTGATHSWIVSSSLQQSPVHADVTSKNTCVENGVVSTTVSRLQFMVQDSGIVAEVKDLEVSAAIFDDCKGSDSLSTHFSGSLDGSEELFDS